ncbi:MAG: GNAT family acetyltransferase [Phycisphaerae bacterium]|nr:GNAT family acetyltransferase [Tepidisphaeraceae bacterium]
MTIGTYEPADEAAVIDLWRRCGLVVPQNNPLEDIRRKVADSPELFLVGKVGGEVVATAMAGYDGHRGWINYLAVAPHLQKTGYGRQIMGHAEELLRQRGCPKINLQVRSTNERVIEFYRRIGFSIDDVASMGKRLVTDTPLEDGNPKA